MPRQDVIFVRLMVLPHAVCVVDDVALLNVLNPLLQFILSNKAISILVYLADDDAAHTHINDKSFIIKTSFETSVSLTLD